MKKKSPNTLKKKWPGREQQRGVEVNRRGPPRRAPGSHGGLLVLRPHDQTLQHQPCRSVPPARPPSPLLLPATFFTFFWPQKWKKPSKQSQTNRGNARRCDGIKCFHFTGVYTRSWLAKNPPNTPSPRQRALQLLLSAC